MREIERRIEELRSELNRLINDIDNCGGDKVVEASQALDKIIYEWYK